MEAGDSDSPSLVRCGYGCSNWVLPLQLNWCAHSECTTHLSCSQVSTERRVVALLSYHILCWSGQTHRVGQQTTTGTRWADSLFQWLDQFVVLCCVPHTLPLGMVMSHTLHKKWLCQWGGRRRRRNGIMKMLHSGMWLALTAASWSSLAVLNS